MLELIGSAVLIWVIFRALDSLFSGKQKLPDLKPGEFIIQTKSGEHYIVRDAPEEEQSQEEGQPANVVRFPGADRKIDSHRVSFRRNFAGESA
ncbi:MAG: hypothetical protein WBN57_11280 [Gammaproteobacteria bacterium]